jgi:hypothetical protein
MFYFGCEILPKFEKFEKKHHILKIFSFMEKIPLHLD